MGILYICTIPLQELIDEISIAPTFVDNITFVIPLFHASSKGI